jgi:uncharacterized protein (DUF302 family)
MAYQYSKNLRHPFRDVVEKVNEALQSQGFSMVSSVDVRDHIQSELGVKFRNYTILTACNPELSYRAISLESHIGILLPCTLVIQEHENGLVDISGINPMETLDKNMSTPSLELVAAEISDRLRTVIDTLAVKKSSFSFSYN